MKSISTAEVFGRTTEQIRDRSRRIERSQLSGSECPDGQDLCADYLGAGDLQRCVSEQSWEFPFPSVHDIHARISDFSEPFWITMFETVETVEGLGASRNTLLKQGVNEKRSQSRKRCAR